MDKIIARANLLMQFPHLLVPCVFRNKVKYLALSLLEYNYNKKLVRVEFEYI
jgi:hypothetical protein